MSRRVIDTNVLIVANNRSSHATAECVLACVEALEACATSGVVLIDDGWRIVNEYATYCSYEGQPGVGDRFFRWLFDNQADGSRCRKVPITDHPDRVFEEFPPDPDLAGFDRNDRKFVAVALADAGGPPILNATDSDWWHFRKMFGRHGVDVEFLCPDLMKER